MSERSDTISSRASEGSQASLQDPRPNGSRATSNWTEPDPDRFFVVPRGVVVEYGPYTFHGVTDFRVERLQGIQKSLEKLGARVKMITCTDYPNRVQLWYMDQVIFTCKITDLQHGGDGELDRLCTDAAKAFDHASRKAIYGLRRRVNPENQELLDPFCPCINPNFYEGPGVMVNPDPEQFPSLESPTKKKKKKKQKGSGSVKEVD